MIISKLKQWLYGEICERRGYSASRAYEAVIEKMEIMEKQETQLTTKDREEIMDDLEALQDKVSAMGFRGQNEYDLFLREEIADYIKNGVKYLEGRK